MYITAFWPCIVILARSYMSIHNNTYSQSNDDHVATYHIVQIFDKGRFLMKLNKIMNIKYV